MLLYGSAVVVVEYKYLIKTICEIILHSKEEKFEGNICFLPLSPAVPKYLLQEGGNTAEVNSEWINWTSLEYV